MKKQKDLRFKFGENWAEFLTNLDDEQIRQAESSLKNMLQVERLDGKKFLDIGSGSGLFSLAARRLGADVKSFDFDLQSVACTSELRRHYFPGDTRWVVEQGSAVDADYLENLGTFDVVYSWGVLHHTGSMWLGIEYSMRRVAKGGQLFIAIYNDQGWMSHVWWLIKYGHQKMPKWLKRFYSFATWYSIIGVNILKYTLLFSPMTAIKPLFKYSPRRGMKKYYDILDWIGGFPFEFAKFDVLKTFCLAKGFKLMNFMTASGHGCHQMVFQHEEGTLEE